MSYSGSHDIAFGNLWYVMEKIIVDFGNWDIE